MFESVAILGRQPELGQAELESLLGADKVQSVGNNVALIDVDLCGFGINRLGGSLKLGKVLTALDTTNWHKIQDYLVKVSPAHVQRAPEGKFRLGLSVYGLDVAPRQINATALALKKVMKQHRNVRVIPNNEKELSTAQVLHNKLAEPSAWELLIIKDGNKTILAQTMFVQDINAYAARDQARPKRDARVGMLPPKLAQIIINLAGSHMRPEDANLDPNKTYPRSVVLDPFCGTGVVLQEALLMGYEVIGTDLEPRMVDYSQQNLDWLKAHGEYKLAVADATSAKWDGFNLVACEAYLGRPFSAEPKPDVLKTVTSDANIIIKKFLRNLANQTQPGFRLCIAVPAWFVGSQTKHLPVLDQLTDMGYTRVSFVQAGDRPLIYRRPGQIVGRELVVLTRK